MKVIKFFKKEDVNKAKCITVKREKQFEYINDFVYIKKKITPTSESYLMGRGKYYSKLFNVNSQQ